MRFPVAAITGMLMAGLPMAHAEPQNTDATTTTGLASPVVFSDPNAIRVLLSPDLDTTLVSQMAGQVATLNASLGAQIKKGETLVGFDCAEAQARLRMSQAEYGAASETLKVKLSLRKLDAAGDLEVDQARADVRRTEAAVALGRAQAAHCTVKAPFDGRVVKTHIKQYQGVNAGEPLLELVGSGPLKIRLNVPSSLLQHLTLGSPFSVAIVETGKSYAASVSAINARIDAVAQTIELEGRLDQAHDELLPGMSGVAVFPQLGDQEN